MGLKELPTRDTISTISIINTSCYEYSATICGVNYTLPLYFIGGKSPSFVLYPPLNWEEIECLTAISWPLYFVYIYFEEAETNCWVLFDYDNNALMYIESSDSLNLPNDPFSSWTIVEGSRGELFTNFAVYEVPCPSTGCGCSIIFTGDKEGIEPIVNGYEVGIFNGKSLYLVDVGGTTGELAIYWNNVTNRWEVNYSGLQYDFPIGDPMAYLESEGECPEGLWTDDVSTPTNVTNISTFLTNCNGVNDDYIQPPIDEYCCSNIAFTNGLETVQIEMSLSEFAWPSPIFPSPGIYNTYSFSFDDQEYSIRFNGINQTWELWLLEPTVVFLGFSLPNSVPDLCPESTFSNWFLTGTGQSQINSIIGDDSSFFIYKCQSNYDVPSEPDIAINCDEFFSCKFVNLLKKQKALLSEDVVSNSNNEVFGLKGCEENWNNIYMKYLIIDVLKCSPYGYYSEATENCLINKLTENCNC